LRCCRGGGCGGGVIDGYRRGSCPLFLFFVGGFGGRNGGRGRSTGHDSLSWRCGHFFEGDDRFCQVCCLHPNHQVDTLRQMSDFSSNTALSLLSSSSPSSVDVKAEHGLLPYPRVRMRCFNLCLPFDTGDLVIVTGKYYFLIQSPTVERKPELLDALLKASIPGLDADVIKLKLQVRSVIHLDESPDDMADFLLALHYGMYVNRMCSRWPLAWFSCFLGAYVAMTRLIFLGSLLFYGWRQSTLNIGYAIMLSQDYLIRGLLHWLNGTKGKHALIRPIRVSCLSIYPIQCKCSPSLGSTHVIADFY